MSRRAARSRSASSQWEQTILLCCLIGSTQMTWGTIVPALPLYVDRFGVTAAMLGVIVAAFGVGRVIANIPAGLALRWWRPRPYLRAVCLSLIVVTAATGFSTDTGTLIAARVAAGILGGAAVTIGFAVLVAGAPADRRGRVMATATAVQMSAGALGAFVGGLALTWFPLEVAFVVASVPLAACLAWDAARPARHYWQPLRAGDRGARPAVDRVASSGLGVVVVALALGSFAAFFARFGGEQGLVPLLAYEQGGLTPLTLGVALAAATLASLAAMPLVGAVIDRGRRVSVLVPATVAAALALLLFAVAEGPWFFAAAIVVYGLASSVAGVVPSVIMSERVPAGLSGVVVGVTRTAGDVGAVVGPLLVFGVFDAAGVWPAVAVIAVVLVVANLLIVRVSIGSRREAILVSG
ncbi:MFS transporter [Conyzicola nivalis]|uniref:MFS transporter n=1 Tax=Conyzicola nivalis TaxID=1477021 RepID=A0A916WGH0_9MICO|nr:MFS transporter [Conyzicola nivalis]GGA98583.1 MFS transporter [Conyzicola nivalis]